MEKILLISARSFGDAIILNSFAQLLGQRYNVTIFTKNEFKSIYENKDYISDIIVARFPMGTNSTINIFPLLLQLWNLRKKRFDLALDVMGDFRERLVLSCISASSLLSIEREKGHPFNNLIRKGLKSLVNPIQISIEDINIYSQLRHVAFDLNCGMPNLEKNQIELDSKVIGIHPFASQRCRMWRWDNWNNLIDKLLKDGYSVVVFGSPNEKKIIIDNLDIKCGVEISCENIEAFLNQLRKCRLLVCLDSFAYHAAYYVKIPSVMINGGNVYDMWKTPLSSIVSNGDKCNCWPCYNKPKCKDYKCIASIGVGHVWRTIKEMLED